MKEQKEMKYMLLETGQKGVLVIRWQKLCRICSVLMWRAVFVSDELGYSGKLSK